MKSSWGGLRIIEVRGAPKIRRLEISREKQREAEGKEGKRKG